MSYRDLPNGTSTRAARAFGAAWALAVVVVWVAGMSLEAWLQ